MPKTDGETKQKRIELVYRLLERHPNGLTEQEIAGMLNFGRRAVNNYLHDLFALGKVDKDGRVWYALSYHVDRLRRIELSPEEAMTLYLATRLLVKQHDKRNESAETALNKLAEALTGDLKVGHEIYQATLELAQRPGDVGYSRVFRTMMQGYLYRRKVAITYRPLKGKPFETEFSPYLLEPSAIGYATYAIGYSSIVDDLRTYKLQRIQKAVLTREEYTVPPDFPGLDYLRSAWSIISGEELVAVKLRFSPRVTERVRESRWHPSQMIEDDPDNPAGCVWTAQIADVKDFVPWLRSWGSDVEVLKPDGLREELMGEAQCLAKVYGVVENHPDLAVGRLLRCWGKTARDDDAVFHPALFHMLDVGYTARVLLSDLASPRWRRMLARALGVDATTLADWLPYIVAMHDIGKLTAAFQSQNPVQYARLKAEDFPFDNWQADLSLHHTVFGQACIQHEKILSPSSDTWGDLWQNMVGGHHGVFGSRRTIKTAQARLEEYEPPFWKDLRILASQLLRQCLLTGSIPKGAPPNLAIATIALTGFAILCDWLGSDEKAFQPAANFSLSTYCSVSANRARRASKAAGFFQVTRSTIFPSFSDLFPDKRPPRPLQSAVDDIPQAVLNGPALVIIEAPTGEGKTEAALAIAHRLAQISGMDALYYALPTTATSNQMFKRVREHLDARLHLPGDVQLIHGQAHLQGDDLEATPLKNGKGANSDMVAWFASKKRALLAPFGVGTVDQVELAALNVKHVALRLVGLAGKVVIFDEVHAYDTYMTTIVARLLEWLAALDTSVIILSATLPQAQRAALADAYGASLPTDNASTEAYPSLWVLPRDGEPYQAAPDAYQPERPLTIQYLHLADDAPEVKARWLLGKVHDGGCACWITNTVARAQDIYDILQHVPETQDIDLSLLHARFPLEEREDRERQLAAKYGPPSGDGRHDFRPSRGIVIGTQVLEQSLDLDFDVMVSDLAPIDLLLQRAGRLHRHVRQRPSAHADGPVLWINAPKRDNGDLNLSVDTAIYAEYFLRQTWNTLQSCENGVLRLPHDCRPLVEAVYNPLAPAIHDALATAWTNLQRKQADAIKKANERLIPEPAAGRAFCRRIARLTFDEDETGATWVVAQTRLGRESVTLVLLERLDDATVRLYPGDETVTLNRAITPAMQRRLLRRHLRVSRPEIVKAIKLQGDLSTLFPRSSRLKGYYPIWLENGQATFKSGGKGEIVVTLDRDLGLVIKPRPAKGS